MYFKRLRDLREDHDMKQSEVAEYLGIQQTVYSRYERGFQSIPVEHLIKLADLYKVSTDYILGRKQLQIKKIKVGQQIFNAKFLFPDFFICDTASRRTQLVQTVCNVKKHIMPERKFF